IDESAKGVAGQRMVVAAGVDVLELTRLVITALGVCTLEKEAFDFICRVQRVALFVVQVVRETLQHSANIGGIVRAVLVDDVAEHEDFAGTKDIGGRTIERSPIDGQGKIAFALRGESSNRGTIERKVVPALDQELLVVVEHVEAAFE